MVLSPESVSALLILTAVLHALAVILTFFRLWFRYHVRRLWWDDFWAALAVLCDAVCMVTEWTLTAPTKNTHLNFEALPTPAQSRSVHILSYWLNIVFFTCAIWFARISIIFSIVRIVPPARSVSMAALGAGGVFVCMWAYILASKSILCGTDRGWYKSPAAACPLPTWLAISEVCTDTISDAILVIMPSCLLRRVKLPPNQRILVLSVFWASILVSVVSAAHTAYLICSAAFIGGIIAEIEGAVSVVVCNLLVIVAFLYRRTANTENGCRGGGGGPPDKLTTVDLDLALSITSASASLEATRAFGTGTGPGMGIETGTDMGVQQRTFGTATDFSSVKFARVFGECEEGEVTTATTGAGVTTRVSIVSTNR